MTVLLARPSFWTEPRDPWAWQRALRIVAELGRVDDPWPTWEGPLRKTLSRRAIAGLYGLKITPLPGVWLGTGLLVALDTGWGVHPDAQHLVSADRDAFQVGLARWLVERSPWARLALVRLAAGSWTLPRGVAPLLAARSLRVGEDLIVPGEGFHAQLPAALSGVSRALQPAVDAKALAPLHAPLYLFHVLNWLDAAGRPSLPSEVRRTLLPEAPAEMLRRVTDEEADGRGFVALERAGRRLWATLNGQEAPSNLAAWIDQVFGEAIARGAIEVHAWAPGQPRHGRGLHGDRDRKLVRWTIHDDFDLSGGAQ